MVTLLAALAVASAPAPPAAGPAPAAPGRPVTVAQAVRELRRVIVAEIPQGERRAKQERCGEAERLLSASGAEGAAALEAELRTMRAAGEKDVFFQATAANVLLRVRGPSGAGAIAEAIRGIDPQTELPYLWEVLSMAAASGDVRVLPLLRVVLATDERARPAVFPLHGMTVPWPYFLWVVYGTFGPAACPDLVAAAAGADARSAISAVHAAGSLRCHAAAPLLRRWAAGADPARAAVALRTLGILGDPADRPLFLACPDRQPAELRRACAYGAVEFGDFALAPAFARLAADEDGSVRSEGFAGLLRVPAAEARGVLVAAARRGGEAGKEIEERLRAIARWNELDADAIVRGDEPAWERLAAAEPERTARVLARQPGDPGLTREGLERTLATWEKDHRIPGDLRATTRAVLAVATADDLPALFRVRGSVLQRQSDECMDEVGALEKIIRVLDRRRLGAAQPNL